MRLVLNLMVLIKYKSNICQMYFQILQVADVCLLGLSTTSFYVYVYLLLTELSLFKYKCCRDKC